MLYVEMKEFAQAPYQGDNRNDVDLCINLIPINTADGPKLMTAPGLELLATATNGATCRGAAFTKSQGDRLFSVHDNDLYYVNWAGSFSAVGVLDSTGGSPVQITFSELEGLVVDGAEGYYWALPVASFTKITDVNFPATPIGCCFIDGYFIVVNGGTGQFYLSALNDASLWTPVQFATAETDGDTIIGCMNFKGYLVLFGEKTIEFWQNTGNPSFPFERMTGATLRIGVFGDRTLPFCAAAQMEEAIYILARGDIAEGFYRVTPGAYEKISTPTIDKKLAALISPYPYAFCYSYQGRSYFEFINSVNNENSNCFSYNITDGTWFERKSLVSTFQYPHRVRTIINAYDDLVYNVYAFDRINGMVYAYGADEDENDSDITRVRSFGPVKGQGNRLFHQEIQLEIEGGANNTVTATVEKTDNDGTSWQSIASISVTSNDDYRTAKIARLGSSKKRFYKFTWAGPRARLYFRNPRLLVEPGRN